MEDDIREACSLVFAGKNIDNHFVDRDTCNDLRNLKIQLRERLIGQEHIVDAVHAKIMVARTGLADPNKPLGSFLMAGPSGVGKTETAKVLADMAFARPVPLVRFDMSDFKEKHSVGRLIGAPTGYVECGQGQLTGALNETPSCVLLLDEMEKAHFEVFDLFLRVLDEGTLADSKGVVSNFKDCIIVCTTNLTMQQIHQFFRPEFLNRLDSILHFHSLDTSALLRISRLKAEALAKRIQASSNIHLSFSELALERLVEQASERQGAARSIEHILNERVLNPLAVALANGEIVQNGTYTVATNSDEFGETFFELVCQKEENGIEEKTCGIQLN